MQIAFGRVRRKTSPARREIPKSVVFTYFRALVQIETNDLDMNMLSIA